MRADSCAKMATPVPALVDARCDFRLVTVRDAARPCAKVAFVGPTLTWTSRDAGGPCAKMSLDLNNRCKTHAEH